MRLGINCLTQFKRFFTTENAIKTKICIVGAGPAGFYAAQHLIKKLGHSEIDIYERLPVPFGLVRFGVAPDHPEVKNVINTFTKTAEHPQIRFVGNVNLGTDVSLGDLRDNYHVVLLTYGAEKNRDLNVPGEDLRNVLPARKIVGWYNGLPSDSVLKVDLNQESVAIFGQGNVAIDVARILLTPVDDLKNTDITQFALESLSTSRIKTVYLIGRRGPLQAAFTIKELREMLKLKNCHTEWRKNDFEGIDEHLPNLARPKKRITELMLKSLNEKPKSECNKYFKPIFHRSPIEILGENKVQNVILGKNKLVGSDLLNKKAELTNERETIECGLLVTSIGYKSIQASHEIPFDDDRGIVKNVDSKVEKGIYVSGWLATGPTGVILNTMSSAFAVAEKILEDIEKEKLVVKNKGGYEEIKKILEEKNVKVVDWKGWKKIDDYERKQGEKLGKPREKIVDIKSMLEISS